jgi:hypothetical protein
MATYAAHKRYITFWRRLVLFAIQEFLLCCKNGTVQVEQLAANCISYSSIEYETLHLLLSFSLCLVADTYW